MNVRMCMYVCMCVYMDGCMCVCIYQCIDVYMNACMFICMYLYVYVYIYLLLKQDLTTLRFYPSI
jgi:hypothetical protein